MNDIKVSVCMVTYNHDRYIKQAVESVLGQRRNFSLEIVIGEDCSTDKTRAIVQKLAEKNPDTIRLRLAERNQGGKPNFMATFALCRGQYAAILEGDDYWTNPNKLQIQVDALDSHPEWATCFHPTQCVYEDGMQGQDVYPLNWTRPEATIEDLFEANFIPTSAALFRHGLFGPLPEWFGRLLLGDWPLHIMNAAHGKIGFLPEVMSAYRVHRRGLWTGESPLNRMNAISEMFTAIDHHFGGKYSAAIERYRANAVRGVMTELDTLKANMARVLGELNRSKSEEATRNADNLTIQCYWNHLANEISLLEQRYNALAQENSRLQAFYDMWTNSLSYRMVRENERPLKKLRKIVRREVKLTPEATANEPPLQKAA
jgi:glycosyltransferase involved in cell wall biosynthesis